MADPQPDDSKGDKIATDPDLWKAPSSVPLEFNCDCTEDPCTCC